MGMSNGEGCGQMLWDLKGRATPYSPMCPSFDESLFPPNNDLFLLREVYHFQIYLKIYNYMCGWYSKIWYPSHIWCRAMTTSTICFWRQYDSVSHDKNRSESYKEFNTHFPSITIVDPHERSKHGLNLQWGCRWYGWDWSDERHSALKKVHSLIFEKRRLSEKSYRYEFYKELEATISL